MTNPITHVKLAALQNPGVVHTRFRDVRTDVWTDGEVQI